VLISSNQRRRPSSRAGPGVLGHTGQHLARVEIHEAVLIGADLMDVNMVEAGVAEAANHLEMPLQIGPASDDLGHVVLTQELGRLLEVGRLRQLLAQVAGQGDVRKPLECGLPGFASSSAQQTCTWP
jgi:hypothetical protein